MLLQNRFNQVDAEIREIQDAIAESQIRLSDRQTYRQALQSVEQACESAIAQVSTALMMLNNVDAGEIPTFKAAIDAQFGTDAIANLPSAPDTEEPVTPAPVEPTEPDATETIEAQVVVETTPPTDGILDMDENPMAAESNGNGHGKGGILGFDELVKVPYRDLQKLAKAKGISCKGMNRDAIATALNGQVTQSDLTLN